MRVLVLAGLLFILQAVPTDERARGEANRNIVHGSKQRNTGKLTMVT